MRADLKLHYQYGAVIGAAVTMLIVAVVAAIYGQLTDPVLGAAFFSGIFVALVVGWLKEARDRRGFGTYDPVDARRTFQGGVLGSAVVCVVALIVRGAS